MINKEKKYTTLEIIVIMIVILCISGILFFGIRGCIEIKKKGLKPALLQQWIKKNENNK